MVHVSLKSVFKWNFKKEDGNEVEDEDIMKEYVQRMGFNSDDDIDDGLFYHWNDKSTAKAHEEYQRIECVKKV